ncbi:MAG: MFS transporter [Elainella sp.]
MKRIQSEAGLWVLLLAGSLTVMPGAVVLPVLGKIQQQFQLSGDYLLIGSLGSIHYLTVALFCPLLGILADRIGRVRVLVASLLLFALFGIAGTWAETVLALLATRMLLGAATGGIAAASLGLLAQRYAAEEDRSQAIALASSAITLANLVYPLLAGLLGAGQWQWAFYLYGIAIPLALAVVWQLTDRAATASLLGQSNAGLAVLGNGQILCFFVTLCLTSAVALATVMNLSLHLSSRRFDPFTIAIVLTAQALGSASISAFGLKWLTRRFGVLTAIGLGYGCMTLALLGFPTLDPVPLIPASALFGIGLGIVVPSHYAALANLTPPDLQSTVLAVGTGMTFLGQFLSPSLFGLVFQASSPVTTFSAATLVCLGLGLLLAATARLSWFTQPRSPRS